MGSLEFVFYLEEFIICGGEAQTLTVCKTSSGKRPDLEPIALLRGHERSVECVAAKDGSSFILSGSFDKCLKIWKMESGKNVEFLWFYICLKCF